MNEQFWWFVARSSGMVAWALITLALVWGVLLATRVLKPYDKPGWLLDLHRWLGALTVGFVAVHLVALVADNYVTFTLLDLVVPFGSDYQRFAVGLGVLAMYLLIVVQVSSVYMRKIPKRWWRAIHVWSYVAVLLTSWHAVLAGTDISRGIYAVAAVILSITPAIALTIRIIKRPVRATPKPRRERTKVTADQG
jgi:sulfoxide reductase heme-binding subunit YedZ